MNKLKKILWKTFFRNFNVALEKSTARSNQCLITLIEKWKSSSDKGKFLEALLTDFSNALDCLPYELLIAKLHAYGFSLPALRLVHSYLSNRKPGKTFR